MDATPHTHQLQLAGRKVVYGDTVVRIQGRPTKARVRDAIRRVIQKHDRGSVETGRIQAQLTAANDVLTTVGEAPDWWSRMSGTTPARMVTVIQGRKDAWGSDLLKEPEPAA